MRHILIALAALLLMSCTKKIDKPENAYWNTIESIAEDALDYSKSHNLSERYCILVDYGLPSGKQRVYIWDFEKHKILFKAYTMHGAGGGSTDETPVLSNRLGSNCSTIGHFAITKQHGTINPEGYRLKDLDPENSNAWERALMIHDSYWVDTFCHRKYIPINNTICAGCVTIGVCDMKKVARLVKSEKKHILLQSFVIDRQHN